MSNILVMGKYKWLRILASIHQAEQIQPINFSTILSSPSILNNLKKDSIKIGSIGQLLSALLRINLPKLLICLIFFTVSVGLTISGPWIVNYLVRSLLDSDYSILGWMLLLMLGYKIAGIVINVLCDYYYVSLGFQYFAALYWTVLDNYRPDRVSPGKVVNIIESDCNILSSIVYSTLTSFFYFCQIMVLFVVLGNYLIETQPYSIFVALICGFVVSQILVNLLTFYVNRSYVAFKDRRIGTNIGDYDDSRVLLERERELGANRKFLLTKVACKFISVVFPILLNIYVFLIADRSLIKDNQYTILILINLIRSPVSSLMLAMNLNAQIANACRRIVELLTGPQSTYENLLTEETSQVLVDEEKRVIGESRGSREVGGIHMSKIIRWMTSSISKQYWILAALSLVMLLVSRFYGNKVTRALIASDITPLFFLGLFAQLLVPIIFYLTLIFGIQKVTSTLFTKLPQELDYEVLNRISGDIGAVDRNVTVNAFQIGSNLTFILGSYLYSILSIEVAWLDVVLVLFLAGAVWVAYKLNRFVMKSRREVFRHELEMKSGVLSEVMAGQKIGGSAKLQEAWSQIFECKVMGLIIENYYVVLISFLMLFLSLMLITLSEFLIEQTTTRSVLLMLCLSLDSDMLMLFYAWVRLQLSLVSFERVLNVLQL